MAKDEQQQKKGKSGKGAQSDEPKAGPGAPRHSAKERPRLRVKFEKELAPALTKELDVKNPMAVPQMNKIVVNIGMGEATQNAKLMDGRERTGPDRRTEAGGHEGAQVDRRVQAARRHADRRMVTLRGDRMYEFFDRLVNIALPRVRDFRGVSTKRFDGRGNYTLGIAGPVDLPGDRLLQGGQDEGHEITIATTARTDDRALALLKQLGMPFRQRKTSFDRARRSELVSTMS